MELIFIFLLFLSSSSSSSLADNHRYISKLPKSKSPQQYLDPTLPPPPPPKSPSFTHHLFTHSFAYTYSQPPFSTPYTPPLHIPPSSSTILLSLSFSSAGDQYDRIAAIWLGSCELLRTSTAEPTPTGIFWSLTKDVTRYSSLLSRPNTLSMMLENIVNDQFTGIYFVNASLVFYNNSSGPPAADVILPVASDGSSGLWFRNNNGSAKINIPANAYKAVLEVYFSFHSNDEFWYSNPPDSYIRENNLTTARGNGAFRMVHATVDGRTVGSVVPFPVVFTGGINPLFWEPVVAIGAFDLPTYDLDVTPFLGVMLDGETHEIGLRVEDGIEFWLVDANLHLWLDSGSESVTAELTRYDAGPVLVERESEFRRLDGSFKIEAESEYRFSGWVNSSFGNLTTDVKQKANLKNTIIFRNNGTYKKVQMKAKMKTVVKVTDRDELVLSDTVCKYKFPLSFVTMTVAGENDTSTMSTNLSHAFYKESYSSELGWEIVNDTQDADGWMLVKDHDVLSGSAGTKQAYQYRNNGDCYDREVSVRDSEIVTDWSSVVCSDDVFKASS